MNRYRSLGLIGIASAILVWVSCGKEESPNTTEETSSREETLATRVLQKGSVVTTENTGGKIPDNLQGTSRVTHNGSFQYSVPIWVPQGRAGMQPQIALSYDSSAQDGLVGRGWLLQATSAITRCGFAGDTRPGGPFRIQWDANDHLCLDGQPLVPMKSGATALFDGQEFRTEEDGFTKIVQRGWTDPEGPTGFDAYMKDGRILHYGATAEPVTGDNSVLRASVDYRGWWRPGEPYNSTGYPLPQFVRAAWQLTSASDRSGNRIEYAYLLDDEQTTGTHGYTQRLASIKYTAARRPGYQDIAPSKEVDFDYESKPDPSFQYSSGVRIALKQRLKSITVKALDEGNALRTIRTYSLVYKQGATTKKSLLQSLTECIVDVDGSQSCLDPTTFDYEPGIANFARGMLAGAKTRLPGGLGATFSLDPLVVGDFNGDGLDDVVFEAAAGGDLQMLLAKPDGGFGTPLIAPGLEAMATNAVAPMSVVAMDFNADGTDDIAGAAGYDGAQGLYDNVFISTFGNFRQVFSLPLLVDQNVGGTLPQGPGTVIFGDVDGNGFPDLIFRRSDTKETCVAWNKADGTFPTHTVQGANGPLELLYCGGNPKTPVGRMASYFGDGIVWIDQWAFDVQSPSAQQLGFYAGNGYNIDTVNEYGSYVDLNGDGIDETLVAPLTGGSLQFATGVGTGRAMGRGSWPLPDAAKIPLTYYRNSAYGEVQMPPMVYLDFDGDGTLDILLPHNCCMAGSSNPLPRTVITVLRMSQYATSGTTVSDFGVAAADVIQTNVLLGTGRVRILDANGDGLPDLLLEDKDGTLILYPHDGRRPDMLTKVQEGRGWRATVSYAPVVDRSVYSSNVNTTAPKGMWVVSKLVESTGATSNQQSTKLTTYKYVDATYGWGHRFIGFKEFIATDSSTGRVDDVLYGLTSTTLSAAFPRIYPFRDTPTQSVTTIPLDGGTLELRDYGTPKVFDGGTAPPFFVHNASRIHSEIENGSTTRVLTTTYGFDIHGNVVTEAKRTGDGYVDTTVTTYGAEDETKWLLGRPTRRARISGLPDGGAETRTEAFEYEPDAGLLSAAIVEPDDVPGAPSKTDPSLKLRTEFGRGGSQGTGLVTSVKTIPGDNPDAGTRVTTFTFDSVDVMYPVTVVKPITSHQTDFSWDRTRGLPLGETDPNNISIKRDFDGMGRLRAELAVDSTGTTTSSERLIHYGALPDGGPLLTEYSFDAGVSTKTDIFGRTIEVQRSGFDGGTVATNYTYDARGFLATASVPHAAGVTNAAVTTYVTDNAGRQRQVIWPDGTSRKTDFSPLATTITNEAGRTERRIERNQSGDIVRSVDFVDGRQLPTSFEIRPFHDVSSVTYPGPSAGPAQLVVTRDIDLRGRLRGTVDPDAKSTAITYNGFGEEKVVTRPDGTTTYSRDALGRPKDIVRSRDGTTHINWDTAAGGGIGQVESTTTAGSVTTAYTYDSVGRVKTSTQTLPASPPGIPYTFATGSYQQAYAYDSKGRLAHVTYPSVGGNAFAITYSYTTDGHLQSIKEDDAQAVAVLWTAKSVDERENITSASLGVDAGTVARRFDVMDQLRWVQTTGAGATPPLLQKLVYEYDSVGELSHRHDLVAKTSEDFGYDNLHRIKTWGITQNCLPVKAVSWTYDDSGNMATRTDGSTTISYFYEKTGTAGPHALTRSSAGDAFAYDSAGNQTSGPGFTVNTINQNTLPAKLTTGAKVYYYEYDGAGRRVRKSRDAQNAVIDIGGRYQKVTTAGVDEHRFIVPAPDGVVVQVSWTLSGTTITSRTSKFLLPDRQGSVDTITGTAGQVYGTRKHDPFGVPIASNDLRSAKAPDALTNLGYTGQGRDDESGLDDYHGRIYDPRFGRFLSPDPIVSDALSSQAYGRYSYVRNAPTRFTDSSGFCPGDDPTCIYSGGGGGGGYPGGSPFPYPQGPPPNPKEPCWWCGVGPSGPPVPVRPPGLPPVMASPTPKRSDTGPVPGGALSSVGQAVAGQASALSRSALDQLNTLKDDAKITIQSYGPAVLETTVQSAASAADLFQTGVMVMLQAGPCGCSEDGRNAADETVNRFKDRQRSRSESERNVWKKAEQDHHIATDKNRIAKANGGPWTPRFEKIFEKAGLSLKDKENIVKIIDHAGPHPREYHQAIFDRLTGATRGLDGLEYRNALIRELDAIKVELQTPGSPLNVLITR